MRVDVETESPFGGASDYFARLDAGDYAANHQASDLLREATQVAGRNVRLCIEWLRVRGSYWVGLGGEQPRFVGDSIEFVDIDENEVIPVSTSLHVTVIRQHDPDRALDISSLEALLKRVAKGEEPEVAESLLADAAYLCEYTHEANRAILLAAIACELRVKQVLRRRAKPGQAQQLIEQLIPRQRPVSGLFDKPMKIVAGRSLRESEPELWKSVVDLFSQRNGIAHRGETAPRDDAGAAVNAASKVFAWLLTD
jgi:hypothetical protein